MTHFPRRGKPRRRVAHRKPCRSHGRHGLEEERVGREACAVFRHEERPDDDAGERDERHEDDERLADDLGWHRAPVDDRLRLAAAKRDERVYEDRERRNLHARRRRARRTANEHEERVDVARQGAQRLRWCYAKAAGARRHGLVEARRQLLREGQPAESGVPLHQQKRRVGRCEEVQRKPEHDARVQRKPAACAGGTPQELEGADVVEDEEPDAAEDRQHRHRQHDGRILGEGRYGAGQDAEARVAEAHYRIEHAEVRIVQSHVKDCGADAFHHEHRPDDPAYEPLHAAHLRYAVCVHQREFAREGKTPADGDH